MASSFALTSRLQRSSEYRRGSVDRKLSESLVRFRLPWSTLRATGRISTSKLGAVCLTGQLYQGCRVSATLAIAEKRVYFTRARVVYTPRRIFLNRLSLISRWFTIVRKLLAVVA